MILLVYLLLATVVVVFSIKLSQYVDIIDKRSNLSGAFIGGVILAAITSLPELFTSLSATVMLGQPELVLGNILGSDIFNLCILAALCLLFPLRFRRARIAASHNKSLVLLLLLYGWLTVCLLAGWDKTIFGISIHSLLIAAIYGYSVLTMSEDDGIDNADDGASPLTMRQVITRFVLCSIEMCIRDSLAGAQGFCRQTAGTSNRTARRCCFAGAKSCSAKASLFLRELPFLRIHQGKNVAGTFRWAAAYRTRSF